MREFLLFGKGFTKVDQWQEGCWINVSDPNQDDFTYLEEMGVPESFISDIRDPNERPRVEKDDDWMLTIMRIPRETGDVDIPFSTVPLGVITNGDLVIVLCYFKNIVIHDFIQYNTAKGNAINNKFALILRLIMSSAVWFLKFLKQINISINNTEDGLERRLRNDDLLKLRNLQKSLVYFNTGIRGNEALISRLRTIYMNGGRRAHRDATGAQHGEHLQQHSHRLNGSVWLHHIQQPELDNETHDQHHHHSASAHADCEFVWHERVAAHRRQALGIRSHSATLDSPIMRRLLRIQKNQMVLIPPTIKS